MKRMLQADGHGLPFFSNAPLEGSPKEKTFEVIHARILFLSNL
jgi:hypothetical protein